MFLLRHLTKTVMVSLYPCGCSGGGRGVVGEQGGKGEFDSIIGLFWWTYSAQLQHLLVN